VDKLVVETVDHPVQRAPEVRQLDLEVLDSTERISQFDIGELGDCSNDRRADDGIENNTEWAHYMIGGIELRVGTTRDRRPNSLAHHVGKTFNEFAEVATSTLGAALGLLGEKVEPTLGEPTDEGGAVLQLRALGAHRPNLLDRCFGDTNQVGRVDDSFQLGSHSR